MKTTTTGPQRMLGGITGKGFMPGRSGNSNGKPKGLAKLVRSRTKDGALLVDLMVRIAGGCRLRLTAVTMTGDVVEVRKRPSARDRMDAVQWLSDRGWGRAKDTLKLEGEEIGSAPIKMILMNYTGDPMLRPEGPPKRMPALPAAAIPPEVEFNMEDFTGEDKG